MKRSLKAYFSLLKFSKICVKGVVSHAEVVVVVVVVVVGIIIFVELLG